MNKKNVRIDVV